MTAMTWFGWTVVVVYVVSILGYIAVIGEPRKPVTPLGAVSYVVVNGLIVVGVLVVGTGKL